VTTEGRLLGDRYRLSQPIGRGNGGFIWIAQDQSVHRTVAAKPVALPRGGTTGDTDLEVAVRRARDAARLKHSCAVTVYDVLIEADGIWLITEYVPSRTMSDFIAGHGKLAAHDTVTLGAQLAAALAAATELGLIHRAVEPANVLLADDGAVQITDFGIGTLHHDQAFRAPEVIAGRAATSASDVFSLGATLYFALHRTTPFGPLGTDPGPESPNAAHDTITIGRRADAATLLPQLLERMLAIDPAQRPSMTDCWEALTAIAEGRQPKLLLRPVRPPASEAETLTAAPAAPPQYVPPAGQDAGTPSHSTTPLPRRQPTPQQPITVPPPAPGWHQRPMPPTSGNPAIPHHNRAAMRVLLVVAILAAAIAGIVFTELVLV